MKESHLFYAPDLKSAGALPADEAAHAVRVLRMQEGDALWATDGCGRFYDCHIVSIVPGRKPECFVEIDSERKWNRPWGTDVCLAVAPTKHADRIEWLAEKATEIGVDRMQWLDCAFSERRALKLDRLERIVVSAMKQSHKACLPQMGEMMKLKHFLEQPFDGDKFIAHCYAQSDIGETEEKPHLFDVVRADRPTLVLIGPEGDFSVEEVRAAQAAGFRSITLGESRLRTETAALVAVQLVNLKKTMG